MNLAPLPTERVGISGLQLSTVALPTNFDMSTGRTLRMREVTIQPGGFLPMHTHANRPAVAYVLQGTLTEHLDGQAGPLHLEPGQHYATHTTPHALQNLGSTPVVFIEVDIF